MRHDVVDLLAVLDIAQVDELRFTGRNSRLDLPRLFGGQLAAQALVAAGRTVEPERGPQSLHAYFLRAGDPDQELIFQVTRLRDGRTLSSRSVDVLQRDRVILRLNCSFGPAAGGVAHQQPAPVSPPPQTLPTLAETLADAGGPAGLWHAFEAVEIRLAPHPVTGNDAAASRDLVWMRACGPVPDHPLVHAAVLCYASDLTLLSAALVPHGLRLGRERDHSHAFDTVSLDHSLWLHHPPRADEWLLFDQHSPVAAGGRALARAQVFDVGGKLVASVAQEGLLRSFPLS